MISATVHKVNRAIGKAASWLSLLLVLVIVVDVCSRYLFSVTSPASFELEWHLFATMFLLSAGWALGRDRHVRVDVFYQKFSNPQKAIVNLVGTVVFLLPLCCIGAWEGFRFAYNAWEIAETSPDHGGLPARFLIKSMIPCGFFLLGIQGLSQVPEAVQTLMKK